MLSRTFLSSSSLTRRVRLGRAPPLCCSFATTAVTQQRRSLPPRKGASKTGAANPPSTIATQLFSLREHHKRECTLRHDAEAQKIATAAWCVLEKVADTDVDKAPFQDVAEMLTAWTYFSQFWERGLDGPSPRTTGTASSPDAPADSLEALGVPLVSRADKEARVEAARREETMPPPPRRSPLDEVLEF